MNIPALTHHSQLETLIEQSKGENFKKLFSLIQGIEKELKQSGLRLDPDQFSIELTQHAHPLSKRHNGLLLGFRLNIGLVTLVIRARTSSIWGHCTRGNGNRKKRQASSNEIRIHNPELGNHVNAKRLIDYLLSLSLDPGMSFSTLQINQLFVILSGVGEE